jgi:ABC-type transporter Mla subunit MlaD
MANRHFFRNTIVGLLFLGSLVILGAITFLIQGVPWARAQTAWVRFPDVSRLRTGDDVIVHGLRVGQVEAIRYDPQPWTDRHILVRISLDRNVPLTEETTFAIRSGGFLAGDRLEVEPRLEARPVAPEETQFTGRTEPDAFEQLGDILKENRQTIAEMVAEIRDVFKAINAAEGPLGRLVKDAEMSAQLAAIVRDLEEATAAIRERRGIIGMLLNDETARDELRAAIADLTRVAADLRAGKGLAGRLINDGDLVRQVEEILVDVHEIVHKANTGEGTIGQAINNREAWDELVRILILARESIEDLREQAPISTFANVLFSVF